MPDESESTSPPKKLTRREFLGLLASGTATAYLLWRKGMYLDEIDAGLEFISGKAEAAAERLRREQVFADLEKKTKTKEFVDSIPVAKSETELVNIIDSIARKYNIDRYELRLKRGDHVVQAADPQTRNEANFIYPPASCLKVPVLSLLTEKTKIEPEELVKIVSNSDNDLYKVALSRLKNKNGESMTTDEVIRDLGYRTATDPGELPIYMEFSQASSVWENTPINSMLGTFLKQKADQFDYYQLARVLKEANLPEVYFKIGFNWLPEYNERNNPSSEKYFWNSFYTSFPKGDYGETESRFTGVTKTGARNDLNSYLFMDVVHGVVGKYLTSVDASPANAVVK